MCTPYVFGLEDIQLKYQYTKFININEDTWKAKMSKAARYIINTNIIYVGNYFITQCLKKLGDLNVYDVILNENAPDFLGLIRRTYKGYMIFHGHNDWLVSKKQMDCLKNCNEYWAISHYLKRQADKLGCTVKTEVIYNGIDPEKYRDHLGDQIEDKRIIFGIQPRDFVFIYTGRVVEEKGVLQMIHAFRKAQFNSNVKLLIVGGEFYSSNKISAYLLKCKNEAKGSSNIIFTGYIPSDEMPSIYQCGDVGIAPSLCQEAFGLSVLEMLISGLPVITTMNGAIPEIANQQCAFLFETTDILLFEDNMMKAMKELYENRNLTHIMGMYAKESAIRFTDENYLSRFEELIDKV